MKTLLVTTTYLEPKERFDKTLKFVDYYKALGYEIMILDNNSPVKEYMNLLDNVNLYSGTYVKSFDVHYGRPSHLDYKYLWRAVHYLQHLFSTHDKIVYMDNDFYVLSDKMLDYIDNLKSGWTTFYCEMYGFPETGCHIIIKDYKEYLDFVNKPLEEFLNQYNNTQMELMLPVTHIEKQFKGDRYGEKNLPPEKWMDYYAQTPNEIKLVKN